MKNTTNTASKKTATATAKTAQKTATAKTATAKTAPSADKYATAKKTADTLKTADKHVTFVIGTRGRITAKYDNKTVALLQKSTRKLVVYLSKYVSQDINAIKKTFLDNRAEVIAIKVNPAYEKNNADIYYSKIDFTADTSLQKISNTIIAMNKTALKTASADKKTADKKTASAKSKTATASAKKTADNKGTMTTVKADTATASADK